MAGRVIEYGHSSQLHDAVRSQIDGLKRAEVLEGHLHVGSTEPGPLGACETHVISDIMTYPFLALL